jgi:hypothetical protein
VKKKTVVINHNLKISEKIKTLKVSDKRQLEKLEDIARGLNKKGYIYMRANPMAKLNEVNIE